MGGPGSLWRRLAVAGTAGMAAFLVALVFGPGRALADVAGQDQGSCDGITLQIERGGTVAFDLPRQSGEKLIVEPGEPLTLKFKGISSAGRADLTIKLPFGQSITRSYSWPFAPTNGEFVIDVKPEDYGEFADLARGAYPLEVTTFALEEPVCTVPFEVSLGQGIEGPIGVATAAVAGVAAAGAVAASGWAASGAHAKLKLQVAVQRRRRTGLRRWIPVPSWKRTLIGSILGTLTGLLMAIVFQQGGWESLTSFTVIRNVVAGALGSVGFGIAWGSVWSFLKPPLPDAPPSITKPG
ncbi:MAG: hypothetical protein HY682_03200 [Chloroflexi bacterium]|nr:hypothetical protein [Chloroflexota bacterium]